MFMTDCMRYFLRKIPPSMVIWNSRLFGILKVFVNKSAKNQQKGEIFGVRIWKTYLLIKALHFRTCTQLPGLPGPECPQFQAHQLTLLQSGRGSRLWPPHYYWYPQFFSLSGIPNIQKYCKEIVKRQSLNIPACQKVCLFLRGQKLAQAVELAILEDRIYNTIIIRLGASQRGYYQAIKKRRDLLGLSTDF